MITFEKNDMKNALKDLENSFENLKARLEESLGEEEQKDIKECLREAKIRLLGLVTEIDSQNDIQISSTYGDSPMSYWEIAERWRRNPTENATCCFRVRHENGSWVDEMFGIQVAFGLK